MSGEMVPTMIRSSSSGRVRAISSARMEAFAAMSEVTSPGAAMRRSLIPVRSVIHASEVDTIRSRSALVSTFSGAYAPVPRMAVRVTGMGPPPSRIRAGLSRIPHGVGVGFRLGASTAIRRRRHPSLDGDDLATGVVAAAGADAVGQHRLLAVRAGDDLHRSAEVVVARAPAVAAHLRGSLLGNSHGGDSSFSF